MFVVSRDLRRVIDRVYSDKTTLSYAAIFGSMYSAANNCTFDSHLYTVKDDLNLAKSEYVGVSRS